MTPESKAEPLVSLLTVRVDAANAPLFVALDGRSGAGKSTLASVSKSLLVEQDVVMNVIEGDQFYAGGSSQTWDSRSDADKVANAMDWRRHTRSSRSSGSLAKPPGDRSIGRRQIGTPSPRHSNPAPNDCLSLALPS